MHFAVSPFLTLPLPHPKEKDTQCLLCESKNYLQQTLETCPDRKTRKRKTSFVKIIDCALVLVLV